MAQPIGGIPLVGRDREVAALRGRLDAGARGQGSVVLITGEPGIGKTRLLAECTALAYAAGWRVLSGRASEAEGMPPYLPFLEALGAYVRLAAPPQLRAQLGPAAAIVAGILPEVALRLGGELVAYLLPPDQARLRLYEAIGEWLAALAAESPLALLLDDLQWADPASLDLLCHIAGHALASARITILGAYRGGDVHRNPALERTLVELSRLRMLTTMTLAPLSVEDVSAMANAILDAPLVPAVGARLHALSEGNPFFAEELLRGWLESGGLVHEGDRWRLAPGVEAGWAAEPMPMSIVGAVRRRLGHLPPEVVDSLRTAAVVGRTFAASLLSEVDGRDIDVVENGLDVAARAHLVEGGRDGIYSFSHDTIRECLYGEVTAGRRARLHGSIGRALESRSPAPDAHRLAELAFHFARSGDRARGAEYSRRAAESARAGHAAEEAIRHYRTALGLMDPADERRGELLLALGEASRDADANRDAIAAFDAAKVWFEQAGDTVATALALHGAGRAWWRLERAADARAAFEAALALLGHEPRAETVSVLVDLASLLGTSLGQPAEGAVHARRALVLARGLDNRHLEAAATRTAGNLLVRSNDLPGGVALLEQALALAEAVDDPGEAAECCAGLFNAYDWLGQPRRCAEITQRRLAFAQRCHDPFQARHIDVMQAGQLAYEGRWAEADALLARAEPLIERLASPEPRALLLLMRGFIMYERAQYEAAEIYAQAAVQRFRRLGAGTLIWYLGLLPLVQAAQGKRREALAGLDELEELVDMFPTSGMVAGEALSPLAMAAVLVGDTERCLRVAPRLAAFAGQNHGHLVDRILGRIALHIGDRQAAAVRLATAEEAARREGLRPELARLLVDRAAIDLGGGRDGVARARDRIEEALALFSHLDLAVEAAAVRDQLRHLSRRPAMRAAPLAVGLSEREAQVLRLVAEGMSNRQIAEALVLSERTVANHLSSIFAKTGSDNRTVAAAFAIRHGLA